MKNLSLVFVLFRERGSGENFLLLGKQAPGKKLEGKRNAFGGKCLEGESTEDCAKREVFEELKMDFFDQEFLKAGNFVVADKNIDCFVLETEEKFDPPKDNEEFVDMKWINTKDLKNYYQEMLEGDSLVMDKVVNFIESGENFSFEKKENKILREQTKNIFK